MKLNSVFQTASVPIPDRSGFDLSREHLLTASVGTLVPVECFEVLPNDTISMGAMAKTTLPPFAVPFMGRVDACLEAFFVPYRLLWKNWQNFITQNTGSQAANNSWQTAPIQVPVVELSAVENQAFLGNGTLADYLGVKPYSQYESTTVSAMKFLAYHMICDHWYRDQNNMKPFFALNPGGSQLNPNASNKGIMYPHLINSISSLYSDFPDVSPVLSLSSWGATDNLAYSWDSTIGLGSLRQRCWAKDYFTTATTRPQAGDAAEIRFDLSGDAESKAFTISDLRAANALQKWLERNNISGTDYGSQILAHFGVTPPDVVLNKPILLGQIRESVYVGSVENNSNAQADSTKNPYGSTLGTAAGFGSSLGKGSLINDFHAKEHGCIMVLYSLVPHAYYNSGIEREMRHKGIGDFAWPEYAHIGDQMIYLDELWQGAPSTAEFGYNQRYSEYKFRPDKISGLLRDGDNLSVYALQRGFDSAPSLGKQFLEIPTDYLDQVFALDSDVGKFGCIVDAYFDTKAIRLLPQYSLPSL